MKQLYFFSFSFLFSLSALAQQNLTLYNMPAVQQSLYVNPAQMPQCRVNVGLPALSSLYFNFANNGFRVVDLVKSDGDSLRLDPDNMLRKMHKNNYLTQSFQLDLVSFGFRVKKNYFGFSIIEKEMLSFRYPKDFFEFAWKGNGAFLGQDMHFNFGLNATHYREYGIGYARELNDKLSIGGKVKYLYGMENVSTGQSDFTFNTGDTYFPYTAHANIQVNTSGVDSASTSGNFNASNYLFGKKNTGAAVDLGAVYKFSDKISFSASLIDLGYIRWKTGVTNFVSANPNAEFKYEGIDIAHFYSSTGSLNTDSAFKAQGDTVKNDFNVVQKHNAYTTKLPSQFYAGANYKLSEKQTAGFVFYGQMFDRNFHAGAAVSYNLKVASWFSVHASYAYINRDWRNLGLGFALTGPVQWYVVTDNVVGFFVPQSVKTINVRTGINLCFGRRNKDRDKDGIPDKRDDCPDVKGLPEFKGCPDSDGDGIMDKLDSCPQEKGSPKFNGCPDKDGDGVIDKKDECPDVPGLPELKGCPDKDGDGIADKLDSCPDVKGLAELHGCPDADGDGVIDRLDSCPNVKGLAKFSGCPDKDNDGVPDKYDVCPADSGSVSSHGCPDKDGDGILDKDDRCPDKAGLKENDGCPLARLHLIDKQGNIIATAIINKEGKFIFSSLPADENVTLRLESYDVLMVNEIGVGTGKSVRVARRGTDGFFRFENLGTDKNKLGKLEEADVQIQLKKEEAEKIQHAMETLEFDYGSDVIRSSSIAGLDAVAELLKQNPGWRLKLSGHTDNVSSMQYNMKLSQKRVESIKKYLVKKGVEAKRIVLKWYGPTKPIAPNDTEAGRQKNRRVEFLMIK